MFDLSMLGGVFTASVIVIVSSYVTFDVMFDLATESESLIWDHSLFGSRCLGS